VADPVGFFGHSFIFALNQFLDAAVVRASMIEVDLGEEFRIGGKGGLSSTSKALGLKNPVAGLWRSCDIHRNLSRLRFQRSESVQGGQRSAPGRGQCEPISNAGRRLHLRFSAEAG
jgi:hypothetical protein